MFFGSLGVKKVQGFSIDAKARFFVLWHSNS